ncbi:MAG: RidA family protein [Streptosporangiales bacterium]|nr:RidA family protein [Streptosporangiales bacterium]
MADTPSSRLAALGITLPKAAAPRYAYVPVSRHGDLLFVSGQLPKGEDGEVTVTGRVGDDVTLEVAQDAARQCTLQGLACAAEYAGGIDALTSVVRVTGFVSSAPDFHAQPTVLDACSEMLGEIFGEAGRHARSAVGVAALPRRAPVEIEFIFAVGGSA